MTVLLPPFVSRDLVAERLPLIFPEGTAHRNYCVRESAASTVFVALYVGAVEESERYLAPAHVYRMTAQQATKAEEAERLLYDATVRKKKAISGTRWYADNSREAIRDETLRDGLVAIGAVLRRSDLSTTSELPRYSLRKEFAALFDPALEGAALEQAIAGFQSRYLSKSALTRVAIMREGAVATGAGILVNFPNGETRQLAPGPSAFITRAVVEVFSKVFLESPVVLWLSESGNKVVVRDDRIASAIGLKIEPDKNLPDLILADMGPKDPLIIFVEVVATDGAMTDPRKKALQALADAAGFDRKNVAFLTAYGDRESAGFKKTITRLAWGSFAWFASEPNHIVVLRDGSTSQLLLERLVES